MAKPKSPDKKGDRRYDFRALEEKWRPRWQTADLYRTGDDPAKPNIYILDYFPYPSGDGLSVGHCRNYVPTCVSARFHRMRGYNVLHPMGWDAFGLPAENYAVTHGIHPRLTTERFAANYRRQMELVECSYDWSREINSADPTYYRWTQWFFLLLFRRGLAYRAPGSQWWCPQCRTILANEQVEDGRCWRCDSIVTRKELEQWYFRITDYAERLLSDLDTIDWPQRIVEMQRNWIGRSEGAEVMFTVRPGNVPPSVVSQFGGVTAQEPKTAEVVTTDEKIPVFTTRPDTLYGVTFLALAPEHPLVAHVVTADHAAEVAAYVDAAGRLSEIDRLATDKEKTGVFTGAYATHPLSGAAVPIWVADYVLAGYGTGAIMGVPGHDARDFEFARRHDLPVAEVVAPEQRPASGGEPSIFTGEGTLINSGPFDGQPSAEAGAAIAAELAARGQGGSQVTYRLRDWLISRQRYWGAPIPIIHCPTCGAVPVPEAELPVVLPNIDDFSPPGDGRSPLARAEGWVNVPCPQCGQPARRETDTMDGFACSSWYFLRFADPHNDERPFDADAVRAWLPVDIYVGGAEHAVMHLLYARFWTKVIHDAGLIDFTEPFAQLRNQGMLLSPIDGQKMSKSKGNVTTPDEVIAVYGTDVLRTYILFLGPFDANAMWDDRGIIGAQRFIERYWALAHDVASLPDNGHPFDEAFERARHQIIRRLTRDMSRFRFNTAVAALMEYVNDLYAARTRSVGGRQWREAVRSLTLLLAPIAPFVTEEVWREVLRQKGSVHQAEWPAYDEALAADEEVTIIIQVNGKLRDRVQMAADADADTLREMALGNEKATSAVGERPIRDVIVVPGRLVNVVTS
ncbi:MAG: leucine--tRNA ligase [Candidatus Promineofilum sp.]|nr:leucine--tRNA ligase [Promineifilum sp.]